MSIVSDPAQTPEVEEQAEATATKAERAPLVPFLEDGAPRLTEPVLPEGYNSAKHKPLKKGDFDSEVTFLLFRAHEYERKAEKCRKEAETIQKLGNAADRGKAKKLINMQARMQELARELAADGSLNLEEILGAEQFQLLMGAQSTGE